MPEIYDYEFGLWANFSSKDSLGVNHENVSTKTGAYLTKSQFDENMFDDRLYPGI